MSTGRSTGEGALEKGHSQQARVHPIPLSSRPSLVEKLVIRRKERLGSQKSTP